MSGRTAFDVDLARTLIDRKRTLPGATLPILHDLLEQFGYIDDAAIPLIADALNISRAETLGVVSFYHDFRRSPFDGRVLKLCRAESCQAMGCEDLVSHLAVRHGVTVDGRTKVQGFTSNWSTASATARSPPPRSSTANRSAVSTAIASTRLSPAPNGRRNERAAFSSRPILRRCQSARTASPRRLSTRRGAAMST